MYKYVLLLVSCLLLMGGGYHAIGSPSKAAVKANVGGNGHITVDLFAVDYDLFLHATDLRIYAIPFAETRHVNLFVRTIKPSANSPPKCRLTCKNRCTFY